MPSTNTSALLDVDGGLKPVGDTGSERLLTDAGVPVEHDAGEEPTALCVEVTAKVADRWPGAPELTIEAIARWGIEYAIGGEDCPLHIVFNDRVRIAITQARDGKAIIGVNPNPRIVDTAECDPSGGWGEGELRLVDILTHEFGHVLGLPEAPAGERGCAMCAHPSCEEVWPTDTELDAVASEHDFEPPRKKDSGVGLTPTLDDNNQQPMNKERADAG